MKKGPALLLFYSAVALLCCGVIALSFYLRKGMRTPRPEIVTNAGRESPTEWFPIRTNLKGVNQNGEQVGLFDLKGKVWVLTEFFAVCPHCAVRNGRELRELQDLFANHPDFHIVCVSIDPAQDDVPRLKDYAAALGAKSETWWFLNTGDETNTHNYLEKELGFFAVRKRNDPTDIEANGRFAHDLGMILVDRNLRVIGKWPLADARSEEAAQRDPELYDRLKIELHGRIRAELAKPTEPTETP